MKSPFYSLLLLVTPVYAQTTWTNINNGQPIGSFFGVAGTSNEVVAVGIDGRIATRSNATGTWSIQTFAGNEDFRDVLHSNGQYLAVREGGGILSSTDGLSWIARSSGTTNDLRALLWDGSNYLAAGANGTILRSADASNWSVVNSSGPFLNALAFSGSQYVATGGFGLLVSSDGITWTAPVAPPASSSFEAATWDGSRFLVGGLGSGIYSSLDGLSWSLATASITWNVESMVSEGGMTWAVGGNAHIARTTDGVSWTELYPSSIGNEFFMDISRINGDLVVAGFNHTVLKASVSDSSSSASLAAIAALLLYWIRRQKG